MTTPLIETMARALWIARAVGIDDPALAWDSPEKTEHPLYWSQRMDNNRPDFIDAAQAALTAITEAGYAVVPREPTEAMVEAGEELPLGYRSVDVLGRCIDINDAREVYRAMIAASPITHCNHTNNGKAE